VKQGKQEQAGFWSAVGGRRTAFSFPVYSVDSIRTVLGYYYWLLQ